MNNSYEFTLNKRIQELDNERRDLKSKIKAWEISYNNLYRRVHGDTLYIGPAEYTMDKNLCMFLRKDIEISEKRLYQIEYEIISCYTKLNEIRQNRSVQKKKQTFIKVWMIMIYLMNYTSTDISMGIKFEDKEGRA